MRAVAHKVNGGQINRLKNPPDIRKYPAGKIGRTQYPRPAVKKLKHLSAGLLLQIEIMNCISRQDIHQVMKRRLILLNKAEHLGEIKRRTSLHQIRRNRKRRPRKPDKGDRGRQLLFYDFNRLDDVFKIIKVMDIL